MLRSRLAELDRRLGELHALRGELAGVLDTVVSAVDAGADPRLCRILERDG